MLATPEAEELLTVKQAAAVLHLDERTIRNHINGRRLPARKLPGGKGWLIRRQDLFAALQRASDLPQSDAARPNLAPAGTDPRKTEQETGILRRTQSPEGRDRALAALDALLDGDEDEQRRAWEHLQHTGTKADVQFRRWDVNTWERLDEETDAQ